MSKNAIRFWILVSVGLAFFFTPHMVLASQPMISIASPAEGQVVYSDEVTLTFIRFLGDEAATTHVYLNGKRVENFTPPSGIIRGLKPGKHELKVVAVTSDGKPTSLQDSVTFMADP